ncbi:MAG TPA: hypothetical protein VE645_16990, partial [Pseudonocardiaceae bacterium]|nr:hypothetical protein [Pseudonocardiaceae bacterium]
MIGLGRPAMRLPGRPPVRREIQQRFWRKIAEGSSSEDAAIACGVSMPVGTRWFRDGGGMPKISLIAPSGRYLSFAEREEIATLRQYVQDRLAGAVMAPNGGPVPGPDVRW